MKRLKLLKNILENDEAFLPTKKASKWKNTKAENGQASGKDIAEFLGWLYLKVFGVGLRLKIIVL